MLARQTCSLGRLQCLKGNPVLMQRGFKTPRYFNGLTVYLRFYIKAGTILFRYVITRATEQVVNLRIYRAAK
jgi:hypothetical protein